MNSPRRRALLGAVGLSALGSTAGCLQDGVLGSETTAAPPESGSGTLTTPDPRHADDLLLKNETDENELLDLRVVRGEDADGPVVAAGRYDVPAGAKLELPNVASVGERYAVEARFPDADWRRFDWLVADCEEYHTPTEDPERTPADDPTLNADAAVLVTDEGLDFGRNACDAIFVSERGAVPASEYAVGEDGNTTTE